MYNWVGEISSFFQIEFFDDFFHFRQVEKCVVSIDVFLKNSDFLGNFFQIFKKINDGLLLLKSVICN